MERAIGFRATAAALPTSLRVSLALSVVCSFGVTVVGATARPPAQSPRQHAR